MRAINVDLNQSPNIVIRLNIVFRIRSIPNL